MDTVAYLTAADKAVLACFWIAGTLFLTAIVIIFTEFVDDRIISKMSDG